MKIILEPSWAVLGPLLGHLDRAWGHLGAFLGRLQAPKTLIFLTFCTRFFEEAVNRIKMIILGSLEAFLGCLGAILGPLGPNLDRFGRSWGDVGATEGGQRSPKLVLPYSFFHKPLIFYQGKRGEALKRRKTKLSSVTRAAGHAP